MKSNRAFYEIHVTVIYGRAVLVAVTSECLVKRMNCKTCTGTLVSSVDLEQRPQNAASDQGLHCLLNLHEVKGLNETVLYALFAYFTGS